MEDMNKSALYTYEELQELKRPELNRLAKKLGINDLKGKNDDIIERMINRTKTVRCTWDSEGDLVAPKETKPVESKRVHPVLGEWNKYIIEARDNTITDETFANNHFSARIKMNEEVNIPTMFADFISNSCYSLEHYYDETKINPETGLMGLHTKRRVSDFFVRKVG